MRKIYTSNNYYVYKCPVKIIMNFVPIVILIVKEFDVSFCKLHLMSFPTVFVLSLEGRYLWKRYFLLRSLRGRKGKELIY